MRKSNIVSVQTPKNSSLLEEVKRPIRMLALGDSYTIGEGVSQSLSWPIQLRDALQAKGYLIEEFTTLAQTGWTTSDLLTAINANNPTGSFDLVTLLIGVNNQYQGGDIEIYRTEFRTLLGLAAKFAGRDPSKILVMSIPDWGGTPFNKDRDPHKISAGIDQFNMVIHRECLAAEIQTLDITCLSRQAPADPAMLAPDGLHPSGELYALWVELILPNALKILPPIQKGNAMQFSTEPSLANHLDEQDPLALFREKFVISDLDTIYLDGNSLGRLPVATISHLQDAIERQWGQRLIRVWNEGWNDTPRTLGDKIAQLIGAQPGEVIVTDSTSANLFKLAVAALRARPGSLKIVSDTLNFPSDLYIFQGIIDLLGRGHQLALIPSHDDVHIQLEDAKAAIDEQTALVSLTHVAFKSAFMYDMQTITGLAHQSGALTLWDLSHSVGAVPLKLNVWGVDLAVGCTYKYLNGGPGSPAFLYVRRDLQEKIMQPMWGWFAAQTPFEFDTAFTPADDISRFRVGTLSMLSMLAVEPAIEILLEAGMERLREKSIQQTEYLLHLARKWLLPLGFRIGSPEKTDQRGSHVSLRHPEAYRINRAMIELPQMPAGFWENLSRLDGAAPKLSVIPDFRAPDNLRLGITPLYTTFSDIYRAMDHIRLIVEEQIYLQYSEERLAVT